jgi:methylthioribose-1-phosphate isomerase
VTIPRSVSWSGGKLTLLDQTRLPAEETYIQCESTEMVVDAIKRLAVRGAPAIGIAAAYGLIVDLPVGSEKSALLPILELRARELIDARPTAVNLAWAVNRMMCIARDCDAGTSGELLDRLEHEAVNIHEEDAAACRRIGEAGLPLIESHPRLLTHCNAGALAVSELGTALAPIYLAHENGVKVHVFVDETRPLLQGARLTAYELGKAGVPHTLIADNMAAQAMSRGLVDAVITGADRVAANGDVANKIGTLNLAILCKHFALPFYVACPMSTVDPATPTGAEIVIEERSPDEVTMIGDRRIAPVDIHVSNPAFDVTPNELISAIITEEGVLEPPFE